MLHEEVIKYRELSGDTNPNTPIIRIGGYLDGYEKALDQEPCEDANANQHNSNALNDVGQRTNALEGDVISRQAAIVQLSHNKNGDDDCDVIIQKDIETIKALPPVTPQQKYEDIAKAFQFGMALGFGEKYDEMDRAIDEIKKVITPQSKTGCKGCIYEKTGNNSTYPCSHCGRCYTDKYKGESEVQE